MISNYAAAKSGIAIMGELKGEDRWNFMIKYLIFNLKSAYYGGRGGIRTPGTSRFNGFQDRRDRPLCHPSGAVKLVIALISVQGGRFSPTASHSVPVSLLLNEAPNEGRSEWQSRWAYV